MWRGGRTSKRAKRAKSSIEIARKSSDRLTVNLSVEIRQPQIQTQAHTLIDNIKLRWVIVELFIYSFFFHLHFVCSFLSLWLADSLPFILAQRSNFSLHLLLSVSSFWWKLCAVYDYCIYTFFILTLFSQLDRHFAVCENFNYSRAFFSYFQLNTNDFCVRRTMDTVHCTSEYLKTILSKQGH